MRSDNPRRIFKLPDEDEEDLMEKETLSLYRTFGVRRGR